jgi:hypothetical protein
MKREVMLTCRISEVEKQTLLSAAKIQGTTASNLLRGFIALIGGEQYSNRDQPLSDLLEGKKPKKRDDRPLSELLKSSR